MIAGIILSAGASSRMGSPKALLNYRGESFVGRLVRVLSIRCKPVIVVLGYQADAIRPAIERAPATSAATKPVVVVNPAPERGQLSSMQTALQVVPDEADGFMFVPVDCPSASEVTIERIAGAFEKRERGTLLVVPQYRGKHGHPVCAARVLAEELLALPAESQAREVVHRHKAETLYIDVDDPGILTDVDDRAAYDRMAQHVTQGEQARGERGSE